MNEIDILQELIARESVTPREAGAFEVARRVLADFQAERIDINGVSNLWLTKNGCDYEKPHLCFAGHIDVVPAGEGWLTEPFKPVLKNGRIFGRGAQDMKAGVAAILAACRAASYGGTLSVLLTSDEEGDAIYGTNAVLERLAERESLPDFAIVAEPTCEAVFGDAVKIGRRGSINGELIIRGLSGHVAYPEKCDNPIDKLARILPVLSGLKLDEGDENFAPSRLIFTDIRGGYEVSNLTPQTIKLMFNVRNSLKTDEKSIENLIKKTLREAAIEDYELTIKAGSKPFISRSAELIKALSGAIESQCGAKPKLTTSGGTSDARFFASRGVAVAEFGVKNDLIHSPNESVPVAEVEKLTAIFAELIKRF